MMNYATIIAMLQEKPDCGSRISVMQKAMVSAGADAAVMVVRSLTTDTLHAFDGLSKTVLAHPKMHLFFSDLISDTNKNHVEASKKAAVLFPSIPELKNVSADSIRFVYLHTLLGELNGVIVAFFSKKAFSKKEEDFLCDVGAIGGPYLDAALCVDHSDEAVRLDKQAFLGSLLSTIMHDMKNPLSGISGYAQLIRLKSTDATIREYCNIILKTLDQLTFMSSELLTFIRGEPFVLNTETFSLSVMLKEMVSVYSDVCKKETILLQFDQPANDVMMVADKARLSRVIGSIILNAREAMENKGTLSISLQSDGSTATITISDTGSGIAAPIKEHLFKPFVTYGKRNRSGLSLAMAKVIVEAHNGNISAQINVPNGTSIVISLPLIYNT